MGLSGRGCSRKGKDFERQVAHITNDYLSVNCRRTPGSGNLNIKGDLIDIDPTSIAAEFHFEAKKQEKLNIWDSLLQAESQSSISKKPLVVFSRNNSKTYAAIDYKHFLELLKELQDYRSASISGEVTTVIPRFVRCRTPFDIISVRNSDEAEALLRSKSKCDHNHLIVIGQPRFITPKPGAKLVRRKSRL